MVLERRAVEHSAIVRQCDSATVNYRIIYSLKTIAQSHRRTVARSYRTVALLCLLFYCSAALTWASPHGNTLFLIGKESSVIGVTREYRVKNNESLIEIARMFKLGYNEIVDANPGLDPFVPKNGSSVLIPSSWILPDSDREGIVINISEMRLYYFYKKTWKEDSRKPKRPGIHYYVRTYPIGIGDDGYETPTGRFRIIEKIKNPSWHVPESIRKERPELPKVVPPGPDNPLGSHALRLSLGSYLIHGTNRPWAVGRKVTHGCLRLYPEDIPELFEMVPVGTQVTIVRQPVKIGLDNGRVYIEVHRDTDIFKTNDEYLNEAIRLLRKKRIIGLVDSEKLYQAITEKKGIPVAISG